MNKFILQQVIIAAVLLVFLGTSTVNAQGFSSILKKIDRLEKKIERLEKKLAELPSNEIDLSGIETKLSGFETQISRVKTDQQKIKESAKKPDQNLKFIEDSIVELAMQVNQLEEKVDAGQVVSEDGSGNIIGLNAVIADLKSLIQDLAAAYDNPSADKQHDESEEDLQISSLELSGFFDILYVLPEDEGEDKGFALGQLEIDVESSISPFISASGALAYGDGVMEVGAAFVDLHWMGESISHPVHSDFVDHSGLLVGQFDVPFGADYQRLASPDRVLVTPPLAVEHTIDGWNDLGMVIYGGHEKWEAQGFAVNGDQGNIAYGGRLTAIFSEYLNIGGSYATIIDDNSDPQVNFMGGDLTINYEPFEVIAEYLVKQDSVGSNQWDITGYYVEGKVGLADWFNKDVYLIGGYSEVQTKGPENSGVDEKIDRITIGAGINIIENASIRIEHLINGGDDITNQNLTTGQFVVSF